MTDTTCTIMTSSPTLLNSNNMKTFILIASIFLWVGSAVAQQIMEEGYEHPVQSGPLADLFGQELYALQMISEKEAQFVSFATNDVLAPAKVIGIYFSADWCGPCRQFTPQLVDFYNKINSKRNRGKDKKELEIVFVSRCRDLDSYGQYFATMPWLALPFDASNERIGQVLSDKYAVKSIPTLVLIDGDTGALITKDARNKIPSDLAGVGFPWRSAGSNLARSVVPGPIRRFVGGAIAKLRNRVFNILRMLLGRKPVAL